MKNYRRNIYFRIKPVFALLIIGLLMIKCTDDSVTDDDSGKYGATPSEYISFLDDNGINYYLDQFGNPYTQGELLLRFDNGFDQAKLDQVKQELADINEISPDSIVVKQCPCGTQDLVLLEFDEKLDEATLEPRSASMGDQDGDDDGLSDDVNGDVTTSNNYYNVPLPQILNEGGELPTGFGPPDISIGEAFAANGTDDKLRIAILDSGLDFDHPSLQNYHNFSIWKGPVDGCYKLGYDFVGETDIAIDNLGHGTQVAGVILDALEPYDVPVAIMPLKISNWNGSVALFDMFCAMSYAVRNGADIVNISAGWYGAPNFIISELIEKNPDVLFVCSAGNEGLNTNSVENHHFPSGFSIFNNVISIAALNEDYSDLADYSNYGDGNVTIAAPGTAITTITPCDGPLCQYPTVEVSGTSFAAPYTTAVAAAVIHCGNKDVEGIRQHLHNLGTVSNALTGKVSTGRYHDFNDLEELDNCLAD